MREESGRSMIEIIGVLAIGGLLVSAAFSMYHTINQRQQRMVATETLKNIATNTKTLLEYSGYDPVSVDFLIKSGALNTDQAPIGSDDWSITPSVDGTSFSINLTGLSQGECAYFITKKIDWATKITVNNYDSTDSSLCMQTGDNLISFIVQ